MKKFVLFLFVFFVFTMSFQQPLAAEVDQPLVWEIVESPIPMINIYASDVAVAPTSMPQNRQALETAVPTATIQANFIGNWPAPAQAAFEYAASIWEANIISSVPIEVEVEFASLSSGVLGSASPAGGITFASGSGIYIDTIYPIALANALYGSDITPGEPEINARFSNDSDLWYYGTDGNVPSGKFDFVTVALHELGHGLGFAGSMQINGGIGSWGGSSGLPTIYDQFTENNAGQKLIEAFPNNSAALASQLTSNHIYFDAPVARSTNAGARIRLYAPAPWDNGSSYSHLNENSFNGTTNSLMTPQVSPQEVQHLVGPVTLGLFEDMGWETSASSGAGFDNFVYLPAIQK